MGYAGVILLVMGSGFGRVGATAAAVRLRAPAVGVVAFAVIVTMVPGTCWQRAPDR
jgi:hypothetical protein